MGLNSGISWTNHTFNPWWGCTKVSPGCDHCYAETFDKRMFPMRGSSAGEGAPDAPAPVRAAHWGKDAPRREFGDKHWNEPLKWNRDAEKAGKPALVFCASMADWCDVAAPPGALERLHGLWKATPWLRWQMLTKRPARIASNLPADWGDGYPNVWLGTTVEDRRHGVPRVTVLRTIPAVVRFLSIEPLIEDPGPLPLVGGGVKWDGIHWVIVGGESGHGARPFNLSWARSIKDQCERSGVAFFMKQIGASPVALTPDGITLPMLLVMDAKGGNPAEWPNDLRVQQFPEAP